MSFSDLSLIPQLLRAIGEEGYSQPTPIQAQAIPHILAGRDLLGLAQTGTGKTAAFALPVLQRLTLTTPERRPGQPRPVRVLVITPTRELASQIGESFNAYGRHLGFTTAVIFGGVNARPQATALRQGVDILVATPGRLLDHMSQKLVRFDQLEVFILDEADRMLDMGFLPDVKRIIGALNRVRQNLFFSATMPKEVRSLANSLLTRPAEVAVVPESTTVEKVDQSVYMVSTPDKQRLIVSLLADAELERVLVFTRTKRGANRLVEHLKIWGTDAAVIHGGKSQNARERALSGFKEGGVRVLVATDIAARGIDVDGVTHVMNYDLPNLPESYVHRIGRTARAGAAGTAIAFCAPDERAFLRDIERTIRQAIPVLALPEMPVMTGLPALSRKTSEPGGERRPRSQAPRQSQGHNHVARDGSATPSRDGRSPRGESRGGASQGGPRAPQGGPRAPRSDVRGAAPQAGNRPQQRDARPDHRAPTADPARAGQPSAIRRAPSERLSGDLVRQPGPRPYSR